MKILYRQDCKRFVDTLSPARRQDLRRKLSSFALNPFSGARRLTTGVYYRRLGKYAVGFRLIRDSVIVSALMRMD